MALVALVGVAQVVMVGAGGVGIGGVSLLPYCCSYSSRASCCLSLTVRCLGFFFFFLPRGLATAAGFLKNNSWFTRSRYFAASDRCVLDLDRVACLCCVVWFIGSASVGFTVWRGPELFIST